MTTKPIEGQSYRIVGRDVTLRDNQGKVGVASNVRPCGKGWMLMLSNLKEWGSAWCMATEIEPVAELQSSVVVSTDPAQAAIAVDAFVGAESDLVAEITKALREQGYAVCVVGQAKAKGSGTTVGYPDMSVRRARWPRGLVCLLEVKTAEGSLSGEQELLHAEGWGYVPRCVVDAISALAHFENEVFGK
jgi:hypothetical protein